MPKTPDVCFGQHLGVSDYFWGELAFFIFDCSVADGLIMWCKIVKIEQTILLFAYLHQVLPVEGAA